MSQESAADPILADNYFSPLLPYLAAGASGLTAASIFMQARSYSREFLVAGLLLLLLQATLNLFSSGDGRGGFWRGNALSLAGVFLLAVFYFNFRIEANPYPVFAPREATLEMRIDELSRGAKNSFYGLGEVVSAPAEFENLRGQKIWYHLYADESESGGENLTATEVVKIRGVLSDVSPSILKSRGYGLQKSADFDAYLASRFIYFKLRASMSDVAQTEAPSSAFVFFKRANSYMSESLDASFFGVDREWLDTLKAMILGEKSLLDAEQKESFSRTGTMHVFAISGLHVGYVAGFLYLALRIAGMNWRIQPIIVLPILLLYVCACGYRPSAMRAFGMIAVVWSATAMFRGSRSFDALVLAACAALIWSPRSLFDAGFQMSYFIVASIFLYGIPLYSYWRVKFPKMFFASDYGKLGRAGAYVSEAVAGAFCISLGAAFASFGLTGHYFDTLAILSPLYSPIFVAGAGLAVGLGFAGFALPDFVAGFTNDVAASIAGGLSAFAEWGNANFNIALSLDGIGAFWGIGSTLAFLVLSGVFAGRNAFLRFVLPPAISIFILTASQFLKG